MHILLTHLYFKNDKLAHFVATCCQVYFILLIKSYAKQMLDV